MSFPGDLWSSVNRYASQALMNIKNNIVGTGDQILTIPSGKLVAGMVASVTADSTGGALKKGIYQWSGSAWTSPQGGIHYHTGAADGGSFQDLLIRAIANTWYVNKFGITKEEMKNTIAGSASITNQVTEVTDAFVEIATGLTLNSAGSLRYSGMNFTFFYPSAFVTRIQLATSTTGSTARVGMGMEKADVTTTNTPKYGFEGCGSGCNNANISVASANVTSRTRDNSSTTAYSTTGNFMMLHTPPTNVKFRHETGTIITKSSNIPQGTLNAGVYSHVNDRANAFTASIQSTNTTSKSLKLWGFSAIGTFGEVLTAIPVV